MPCLLISTDYVPTVLGNFSADVLVNRQFLIRASRTLLCSDWQSYPVAWDGRSDRRRTIPLGLSW
ncbi:hypothetical protein SDJN02_09918, partial [Cucurbita argyrosperma subsp. argyrosperma]